jgi:hypothetical protein
MVESHVPGRIMCSKGRECLGRSEIVTSLLGKVVDPGKEELPRDCGGKAR